MALRTCPFPAPLPGELVPGAALLLEARPVFFMNLFYAYIACSVKQALQEAPPAGGASHPRADVRQHLDHLLEEPLVLGLAEVPEDDLLGEEVDQVAEAA